MKAFRRWSKESFSWIMCEGTHTKWNTLMCSFLWCMVKLENNIWTIILSYRGWIINLLSFGFVHNVQGLRLYHQHLHKLLPLSKSIMWPFFVRLSQRCLWYGVYWYFCVRFLHWHTGFMKESGQMFANLGLMFTLSACQRWCWTVFESLLELQSCPAGWLLLSCLCFSSL